MSDQFLSRMSSDRLGILRGWYPVREATEEEVAMLVGRPVNA